MLFPDADSASPLPCIASLPYGRSPIRSRTREYFQQNCMTARYICSPVIQNSVIHLSYRNLTITLLIRNSANAIASFSIRNPFFTDASRPKSADAPLKSRNVEQVPPCIYRAELVGDLASPSPSSFRLLKDKKQPASGLFSAPKPWQYFVRPLYNESYQTKRTILHIRLFSHTSNHCVRQFIIHLYEFAAQSSSISNRLPSMLFVELSIFADVSAASSLSKASTSVT